MCLFGRLSVCLLFVFVVASTQYKPCTSARLDGRLLEGTICTSTGQKLSHGMERKAPPVAGGITRYVEHSSVRAVLKLHRARIVFNARPSVDSAACRRQRASGSSLKDMRDWRLRTSSNNHKINHHAAPNSTGAAGNKA